MWRRAIVIIVVAVYLCIFILTKPDLFPGLNTMIDHILDPGKRGNLFKTLSKTTVTTNGPDKLDYDFGPGWIRGAGTFRLLPITTIIPNPSGDLFYFCLAICGDILSATVNNLIVGRTYQLSVYIIGPENTIFSDVMDEHILVPKTTNTEFIRVGPTNARATATSHTIHFCNDSITGPIGTYAPILLTGLLFEYK